MARVRVMRVAVMVIGMVMVGRKAALVRTGVLCSMANGHLFSLPISDTLANLRCLQGFSVDLRKHVRKSVKCSVFWRPLSESKVFILTDFPVAGLLMRPTEASLLQGIMMGCCH